MCSLLFFLFLKDAAVVPRLLAAIFFFFKRVYVGEMKAGRPVFSRSVFFGRPGPTAAVPLGGFSLFPHSCKARRRKGENGGVTTAGSSLCVCQNSTPPCVVAWLGEAVMHGLRETAPPGPYFPFHRDETYPRTLCVNFKRLEVSPPSLNGFVVACVERRRETK